MQGAALLAAAALFLGAAFHGCAREAPVVPVGAAGIDSLRRSSGARVVLVNVWATWCRPCMDEMPGLVKVRGEYSRDDLEVILLSADDLSDLDSSVVPFLRKTGVDFPTYIIGDKDQDAVIRALDPEWSGALPATMLTVRDAPEPRTLVGERTVEQFREEIDALLAR
jgi:thiol-disulfide isomerase/thioredoxin